MGHRTAWRMRRFGVRAVIAIIPTAMVAMIATNLLAPTKVLAPTARPASYDIIDTAAIVDASNTIGLADSDLYGLSNPDGTLDQAAVLKTLDAMQALGVNDVRVLIPWAFVEPVPPGFLGIQPDFSRLDFIINAANARGMGVLGDITSTPTWGINQKTGGFGYSASPDVAAYTAFATTVAQRYAGKVSAYEVSNEVNSIFGWTPSPDATAYTALLKSAYTAIKGADPTAMVVAGALVTVFTVPGLTVNAADFVQSIYDNGGKGYFDALSIHPYQYTTKFSQGGYDPNGPISQLIDIRNIMIAHGDQALRIWATEYGLPTGGPNGVSQQTQADFIKDFLQTWAGTTYAGPAFIYTTRDQPGMENTDNGSLGVYTSDWQEKLAAKVIKALTATTTPVDPPPNPVDPGQAIADALNAVFQQAINGFVQAYAAALQTAVQAAATAYVNAIAQAINAALGNLFAGLAVPTPQQQAIVAGVSTATQNISSLKIEPAASAVSDTTAASVGVTAAPATTTTTSVNTPVTAAVSSVDTTVSPVTPTTTSVDTAVPSVDTTVPSVNKTTPSVDKTAEAVDATFPSVTPTQQQLVPTPPSDKPKLAEENAKADIPSTNALSRLPRESRLRDSEPDRGAHFFSPSAGASPVNDGQGTQSATSPSIAVPTASSPSTAGSTAPSAANAGVNAPSAAANAGAAASAGANAGAAG